MSDKKERKTQMSNNTESLQTKWEEMIKRIESSPTWRLESLLMEITERICDVMDKEGVSRTQLAERLGVSKPWVTKFLSGNRNLTLKSLARVANALELDISIEMQKKTAYADAKIKFRELLQQGDYGVITNHTAINENEIMSENKNQGATNHALAA